MLHAWQLLLSVLVSTTLVDTAAVNHKRSSYGLVLYWGQEQGSERSLADYCTSSEGVTAVVLAFLNQFGNGVYPNGMIDTCTINADGTTSDCSTLASDISTCQANGVKVLVSLGGALGNFSIAGTSDAQNIASELWNSYANPDVTSSSSPRPFGDVTLDGWDFDIEKDPNNESSDYLGDLVTALREYFSDDTSNTYLISGAPQCYIPPSGPVANMGDAIIQARFDWIWPQFYGGNCAAASYTNPNGSDPSYGKGTYSLPQWATYLAQGASSDAQLFVGLPASTEAGGNAFFYIPSTDLPKLLSYSAQVTGYAGVMLWNAAASDSPVVDGCNYAEEVRSVLDNGAVCS